MSASTKQCISIPIIDDSVGEVDQECFTISLSESSGTADLTLSPAIATVCINDTDGMFREVHNFLYPLPISLEISHLLLNLCIVYYYIEEPWQAHSPGSPKE